MDNTDFAILEILRKNARESASVIGEKVNMSVSAVGERIRKLEASGVIKHYTVVLDEKKMGRDVWAYVLVSIERPKYNEGFCDFVQKQGEIVSCNYMAGNYDYLLVVNTDSTAGLERVIREIKGVPGTTRTMTTVVLSNIKNGYTAEIKQQNN